MLIVEERVDAEARGGYVCKGSACEDSVTKE